MRKIFTKSRKRDRGWPFRITFDYPAGGLPFCDRKRSWRKRVGCWARLAWEAARRLVFGRKHQSNQRWMFGAKRT